MIAAFGALVPLAAMLNRHEWLFGKGQVGLGFQGLRV
jgi:hypothetical protein